MALQDDIRVLARLPAFRELEVEALKLIALSAETRILRAGGVLFRAGEPAESGFILLSGSMELETPQGKVALVRPPTLLGETALLAETDRPGTATAREPSGVLEVTRKLYRRILTEYPDSAQRLRRIAADRMNVMQADFERFAAALAR